MRLKAEFRLLGSMTLDKVDSKDLTCNRKLVNELAGQSNERLRLDASINNNRKRGENDKWILLCVSSARHEIANFDRGSRAGNTSPCKRFKTL